MYKLLLFLLIISYKLESSEFAETQSLGIYVSLGNSFNNVDFKPKSNLFFLDSNLTKSSSNIYSINMDYNLRVFNNFYLNLGGGFDYDYGRFIYSFNDLINIDGNADDGRIDKILNFNRLNINSFYGIKYNVYKKLNFKFLFNLSHQSTIGLESYEEIILPADKGVFKETGLRKRKEFSDTIVTNKIQKSLTFGLDYLFPMSITRRLNLNPFLNFNYSLDDILPSQNWKRLTFNYGLGLTYYFGDVPHQEILTLKSGKIVIPEIKFTYRLIKNGKEIKTDSIVIEKERYYSYSFFKVNDKVNSTQKGYSINVAEFDSILFYYKVDQIFKYDKLFINLDIENIKKTIELKLDKEVFSLSKDYFKDNINKTILFDLIVEMLRNNQIYNSNSLPLKIIYNQFGTEWMEYIFTKDFTIDEIITNIVSFVSDSKRLGRVMVVESNDSELLNRIAGEINYNNIFIKNNNETDNIKLYWKK